MAKNVRGVESGHKRATYLSPQRPIIWPSNIISYDALLWNLLHSNLPNIMQCGNQSACDIKEVYNVNMNA